MIALAKKYMTVFAAAALVAVAISACGGGDGTPRTTPDDNGPTPPPPENVDLSPVSPGFMAEAGTVTVKAGESQVHGDIEFSCPAGGADCTVTLEFDNDGILRGESTGGNATAMNSADYGRRVSIREEISHLIEESTGVHSELLGTAVTTSTSALSGSAHLQLAQSHRRLYTFGVPWRNDDGDLNFSMSLHGEELPEDAAYCHGRSISGTSDDLISHDLGSDWQVFSTVKEYDGAGTLEVRFVTDVEASESPGQTWVGYGEGASGRVIALDNVPSLQAGHDWQGISIGAGDSVAGTLDGVAGEFSCYGGQACGLEIEPGGATQEYYPGYGTVTFTPSDGCSPEMFSATTSAAVPTVDYLSFGIWWYVPDDVDDSDSYDFGVFAGGGDPFDATIGAALTGSATYVGDAIGMYSERVTSNYVQDDEKYRVSGSFTADVTLTADFDGSTLSGRVHDITYDNESSHSDIYLREALIGAGPFDPTFDTTGDASSAETGEGNLNGQWSAAFFGNDSSDPTAHPTGVAGTFGVGSDESGLVGAFGANRR